MYNTSVYIAVALEKTKACFKFFLVFLQLSVVEYWVSRSH